MANQMTGRVYLIRPTETIISKKTGNPFYKREIVLDCTRYDQYTGARGYENFPSFEFSGNNCSLLDPFNPGDVVTITFDIQGTKSSTDDRYFNSVRGYKIELKQQVQQVQAQPQTPQPQEPQKNDDLPF